MKVNKIINETTTSGSIASVSAPMSTQKRNGIGTGVYDSTTPRSLLTGKASKKKYANSLKEYTGETFRVQVTTDDGEVFTYKVKADNQEQALKKIRHRVNKSGYDTFELKVLSESKKTNESAGSGYPQEVLDVAKQMKQAGLKHITGRMYGTDHYVLYAYAKEYNSLSSSIMVEIQNGKITKATVRGGGKISGPTNNQILTFDDDVQVFDNLNDALKSLGMLSEAKLDEEDKIIAPGKGKKLKTGLYKPGQEKKLSHFKHPFKSSGVHISDSRGNKVGECENEDIAKEVTKALNEYVKIDENIKRVGAYNTKAGILKLLKSGHDPMQYFLINPKGEVVKQFRGTEDEVKRQVQQDINSTIVHENRRKK